MKTVLLSFSALVALIYFGGCSYRNVDTIKSAAPEFFKQSGYEIVQYEGYQIGSILGAPGGKVWFQIKRDDSPIIYNCFLTKWGSEFHIYNMKALNAVSNEQP